MELLEPGFAVEDRDGFRAGRFRVDADPVIDAAIDGALAASEWEVSDVALPRWYDATAAAGLLLVSEAWATDRALVARRPGEIGQDVVGRLKLGSSIDEPRPGLGPEGPGGMGGLPRRDLSTRRRHRHAHIDRVPASARGR